jgi:hypothetical protein
VELTLLRRGDRLAEPAHQLAVLASSSRQPPFARTLAERGLGPLHASGIEVLQINVGKKCNQTCRHCHVDAGPDRREMMTRATMQDCLDAVARAGIPTVDITGGAPELHPDFRWLVREARRLGAHVIDRCNLTILLAPGHVDLPALVFNPVGPKLPPDQAGLEATYRRELKSRYGIEFTRLFTITNMPISRFLDDLLRAGEHERYMETLVDAFNPAAVAGLMCRTTLSVGWDGRLFDCDFNQMLDLPLAAGQSRHIRDFDLATLAHRPVMTHQHCYGCTAGGGSGCQGAITPAPGLAVS